MSMKGEVCAFKSDAYRWDLVAHPWPLINNTVKATAEANWAVCSCKLLLHFRNFWLTEWSNATAVNSYRTVLCWMLDEEIVTNGRMQLTSLGLSPVRMKSRYAFRPSELFLFWDDLVSGFIPILLNPLLKCLLRNACPINLWWTQRHRSATLRY